jgi:hypothetical protein
MNEKGEITLLTSENIKPYFLFIIFRVRFANQHILCNPDPKNKLPIKSHVGNQPRTDM